MKNNLSAEFEAALERTLTQAQNLGLDAEEADNDFETQIVSSDDDTDIMAAAENGVYSKKGFGAAAGGNAEPKFNAEKQSGNGTAQASETAFGEQANETNKNQEHIYGKFKTAQELLKAYGELEREFTRRAQKLAELEKAYAQKPDSSKKEKSAGNNAADAITAQTKTDSFFQDIESGNKTAKMTEKSVYEHLNDVLNGYYVDCVNFENSSAVSKGGLNGTQIGDAEAKADNKEIKTVSAYKADGENADAANKTANADIEAAKANGVNPGTKADGETLAHGRNSSAAADGKNAEWNAMNADAAADGANADAAYKADGKNASVVGNDLASDFAENADGGEVKGRRAFLEKTQEQWRGEVDKFFEQTPSAKPFAKDIAKEILAHPELTEQNDCFSAALTRVLIASFRTPQQLANDKEFIEKYVIGSDSVRNAVISDYLKSLKSGKPPVTLSKDGESGISPKKTPKNLEEAGRMFLKNNK
jgi:hypothetical protein